jgi:hypothetical protein
MEGLDKAEHYRYRVEQTEEFGLPTHLRRLRRGCFSGRPGLYYAVASRLGSGRSTILNYNPAVQQETKRAGGDYNQAVPTCV